MKIAYLINTYPSPSHSFVRREIAALEASGVAVQRFALRSSENVSGVNDRAEADKTRYVLDAGVLTLVIAVVRVCFSSPASILNGLRLAWRLGRRSDVGVLKHLIYLAEACVLVGWLRESAIQHLHAHFGTNSTTVAMLARVLGGPPYSFTAHGPEEFDKPITLALGEKIDRSAFVVAVCSFGRSQLFRWCDREQWKKIHIVRCGVDDLFLKADRSPTPTAPRLLQVGRLSEQKGQLLLIDAARRLAERGIDFNLVLVGDGELRGELESLIKTNRLADRVTLAGWQTGAQIRDHMLASRALIMPSFAEGLPVVLMESLALGRPVVSTFVAGIPELVDNSCGWLVPAGDAAALADAMAAVLSSSPVELDRLGAAGRERIVERHDASTEAARLASLFRRSISEAGVVAGEAFQIPVADTNSVSN